MQPIGKLRIIAGVIAILLAATGVVLTIQSEVATAQDSTDPNGKKPTDKGLINPALGF